MTQQLTDNDGDMPIHEASCVGQLIVVKYLIPLNNTVIQTVEDNMVGNHCIVLVGMVT